MEFLTAEAQGMVDVLRMTPPLEAAGIELQRQVDERLEADRAGVERVPKEVNSKLQAYDSKLRARYEFRIEGMVIERLAPEAGGWLQVSAWPEDEDRMPIPIELVIEMLGAGDMRKYRNTEEYLEKKREKAKKVKEANIKAGDSKLEEAIDSLSSKQVKQFAEVERAMLTGETVIAHGDDERFLDYAHQITRRHRAEGKTDVTPAAGHFTRRGRNVRKRSAVARRP
ncbi:MAG TPA: hypothetical protein VGR03_15540 [Candidatus Acidoferrum sp.]|nr:hypothetical protein [Candidatus Acidoferrum sp.]